MKILEINKFYYHKRGAEKHFFDLIALLESSGHEVAVFSMNHERNYQGKWNRYFLSTVGYNDEFGLWQKIKGAARMFHSFEAKKKINSILDDFNPDVVHIHNIYHQLSPTILFEIKKRNIPILMTVHDFKIINPNHSLFLNGKPYERCRNGRFYQCFLDKCVKGSYAKSFLAMLEAYWHEWLGSYRKNIDRYIVPSEFVKKVLVERGFDADRISVLPHFISDFHTTDRKSAIEKRALYMGAISKDKGILELIGMFEEIDEVKLFLAGNMEGEIDFAKLKNTEYLGFLSKESLQKKIAASDCIVSGSRLPETFGLVALEALRQGKPFFGFRTGAFGEIIKNGENGFLSESNEEFEKALKDFFLGKTVFNGDVIRKNALEKHGSTAYLEGFEKILREVSGY